MAKRFFLICAGLLCLTLTYQIGAQTVRAQTTGSAEIATGTYDLTSGDRVPLPSYADGTPALPSECTFVVSGYSGLFPFPSPYVVEGVHVGIAKDASGGTLEAWLWNEQGRAFSASATITVIAIRASRPTSTRQESWGELKSRYR